MNSIVKFLDYIGQHYNEIHDLISQYNDFNEDVFHNTILSCHKAIEERNLQFKQDTDIIKYFISSYRTNILRNYNYYYNKNKDVLDVKYDISGDNQNSEYTIDLQIILDLIKQKFKEVEYNAYVRYITEGICIEKLQKETGIKNLKQKIKNIKNYIQKIKNEEL